LNLTILPGVGVWMLGKKDIAKFHIIGWLLSCLIVNSGGLGLTGALATILGVTGLLGMLGSWAWSNFVLFQLLQKEYQ